MTEPTVQVDSISKYRFNRALRPFSFPVALVTCLVGIVAAADSPQFSELLAAIILIAALALQAGVNLINDYSDLSSLTAANARCLVQRNFRIGIGCFLVSTVLGLYIVAQTGPELLWLFVIGLVGALGYTLEPINFKRRGLAVVLVFWLMGVLMVGGSYFILTGSLTSGILWQSVPVSLITSLLLLSNELRDCASDQQDGINTLTVRIGAHASIWLYRSMLLAVFLVAGSLWYSQSLDAGWWLLSLPVAGWLLIQLRSEQTLANLPPLTGRFFLLFGVLYCFSL